MASYTASTRAVRDPMHIGYILYGVVYRSETDGIRPYTDPIQTVWDFTQLRYSWYWILYMPCTPYTMRHGAETYCFGQYRAPIHTVYDPVQTRYTLDKPRKAIRYTLYSVLYSSDSDCMGSDTAPIQNV